MFMLVACMFGMRVFESHMCGIKHGDICCVTVLSHSVFDGVDVGTEGCVKC